MQKKGTSVLHQLNSRIVVAVFGVSLYLSFRQSMNPTPTMIRLLIEVSGTITLGLAVSGVRDGLCRSKPLTGLVLSILLALAFSQVQLLNDFPNYWAGFGVLPVVLGILLSLGTQALAMFPFSRRRLETPRVRWVYSHTQNVFGAGIILWLLPSLIQPMDAFLNLGDGTEKVLDELAGWASASIPGVDTLWAHTSLLGLPLWPLSLVDFVSGGTKITLIVVYLNLLCLGVVFLVAQLLRRMFRGLNAVMAFGLALIPFSLSGDPFNTSLFQEMNYIARLIIPLWIGVLLVRSVLVAERVPSGRLVLFGVLAATSAFNNFEIGGPSALSLGLVLVISGRERPEIRRRLLIFATSQLLVVVPLTIWTALNHEEFLAARFGVFSSIFGGLGETGIHNNTGPIPPLGAMSLLLSMSLVLPFWSAVAMKDSSCANPEAHALGTYLSGIVIFSLPYFLYGVGGGAFRAQMYLVILALIAICWFRLVLTACNDLVTAQNGWRGLTSGALSYLPAYLAVAVMASAIVQAPNGVWEWKRVSSPVYVGNTRNLDEWSPESIDWIQVKNIESIVARFGDSEDFGWWYKDGNAIEILTGIKNLSGTTGFEYGRSPEYLKLICRELTSTNKRFVITSQESVDSIQRCEGLKIIRIFDDLPNSLVVVEI
jgi:hypothetical protein